MTVMQAAFDAAVARKNANRQPTRQDRAVWVNTVEVTVRRIPSAPEVIEAALRWRAESSSAAGRNLREEAERNYDTRGRAIRDYLRHKLTNYDALIEKLLEMGATRGDEECRALAIRVNRLVVAKAQERHGFTAYLGQDVLSSR